MAVNKLTLEKDGLVVGATQLVTSSGGVTIGQNLAVAGNIYAANVTAGNILAGVITSANITTSNLNVATSISSTGNISDGKGDVRSAPINSQPGSYVVTASDAGKTIVELLLGAQVIFNASVFSAGDMVSVVNTSAGSITLVQGTNVTLRLAGTGSTGTRTLASNGMATVVCTVGGATPTFYCSGAGLT